MEPITTITTRVPANPPRRKKERFLPLIAEAHDLLADLDKEKS
jgi:hypothetical protein